MQYLQRAFYELFDALEQTGMKTLEGSMQFCAILPIAIAGLAKSVNYKHDCPRLKGINVLVYLLSFMTHQKTCKHIFCSVLKLRTQYAL